MDKAGIQELFETNPQYRDKLFAWGFFFTDAAVNVSDYPFFGLWQSVDVSTYHLLIAPNQHCYHYADEHISMALVGHAYDPIDMIADENTILTNLAKECSLSLNNQFWTLFNQLTGVFTLLVVADDRLYIVGDPSGMQTAFYTYYNGHAYVSSHTNLLGDLLELPWDDYVTRLTHYRFFKLLGNSLPGDLTQFRCVKRLIPNHYVQFKTGTVSVLRFYAPSKQALTHDEIVNHVSSILHANLALIGKKWAKPAISLTGGCDSKTTLSCAKDLYGMFSYFSYISTEPESVDAIAAKKICDALGLEHTTYNIPESNAALPGTTIVNEIINWNTGNIRYSHPEDVRKRVYFADTTDFDVEVKSWASEIGRAYYSKRFNGRTDFGVKPTPRKCTTLYKFFLNDRKLVRDTDSVFEEYLDSYFARAEENPVEWQEQFFWEFRVPSWNGLVITGEHRYSFDITIPYNNRLLLVLLLSAPMEDRINDVVYRDIRQRMNPSIDDTGIAVTNLKHTSRREKAEGLYYTLHSKVWF